MADFNNAIMTNAGAALLAATTAGTAKIKFTKLVTGSGSYTESEKTRGSLQARTNLKALVQEFPFSKIEMETASCVKLVALVTNAELSTGYYVNEVGIYAADELNPDAEPVLYSIAIANIADYLPPYNGLTPSTITQEYYATVDNALEVTIEANTGAVALAEDLHNLESIIPDTYLRQDKVANNLVTNVEGYALSAEQGVVLDERLSSVENILDGKYTPKYLVLFPNATSPVKFANSIQTSGNNYLAAGNVYIMKVHTSSNLIDTSTIVFVEIYPSTAPVVLAKAENGVTFSTDWTPTDHIIVTPNNDKTIYSIELIEL